MFFSSQKLFSAPNHSIDEDAPLPSTRKKLFLSVMRQHWFSLFLYSLGCAILLLPTETWCFLHLLLLKHWLENPDALLSDYWLSRFLIYLIPFLTVSGPFLAAPARLMRNWARGEYENWVSVSKHAISTSWRQTLLLTFLTSCLPLLLYSAFVYRISVPNMFANILFFTVLACSILWIMLLPLLYLMSVTYTLPFTHLLWNGIFLTFQNFGVALKRLLLSALPIFVLFFFCIIYPYAFALLTAVYLVLCLLFLYGLHALVSASYANSVCEQGLNAYIPGARVNIGLDSEYSVSEKE